MLAGAILATILPTDPIPNWQEADIESRLKLPAPVIWRIAFVPKQGITLTLKDDAGRGDEGRWGFLPLSYVQELVDAP